MLFLQDFSKFKFIDSLIKMKFSYEKFLDSYSKKQWKKFGVKKRFGLVTPLFSIFSNKSTGIGEYLDLKLLVDWCLETGLTIIQLLPLNDTGVENTPYAAQSSFALDPVYLSLESLKGVDINAHEIEIKNLKNTFVVKAASRLDFNVKFSKIEFLRKIFRDDVIKNLNSDESFLDFCKKNAFWLTDYALYKILKSEHHEASWIDWPKIYQKENLEFKNPDQFSKLQVDKSEDFMFYIWLQWQCFLQLNEAKNYANSKGVFIQGDLPFLVCHDSADVWAHKEYFKLDRASGAPPDAFSDIGQRWGMPPYDWKKIEKDEYKYFIQKLKYAENFYDMFRIDHAVGLFRIWTIDLNEDFKTQGLNGVFDPSDVSLWKDHGRNLLKIILDSTEMLPCAEDLGVVPDCSFEVLEELCIPGIDVQRWYRNSDGSYKSNFEYRINSASIISNHDTDSLASWWLFEASINPDERAKFLDFLGLVDQEDTIEFRDKLIRSALKKIYETPSIFSIQLLQDLLCLDGNPVFFEKDYKINTPGTIGDQNWSIVMPYSLEEMLCMKSLNEEILGFIDN